MEEAEDNTCIAKLFDFKGKKKRKKKAKTADAEPPDSATANNGDHVGSNSNVTVSLFDFSVDNFFRDMDTIARLCGQEQEEERHASLQQSEIQRMASSVTFLREWRDFKYPSKRIRFAYGLESSKCSEGKHANTIDLPQFSSAAVPKHHMQKEQHGDEGDFVMNVGGPVWALDWCPQTQEKPDCSITCEYIAVASHPPSSSYHKMGASLTGRGVIQVWCLLNIQERNEEVSSLTGKKKKKLQEDGGTDDKLTQIKKPRGRPRKSTTVTKIKKPRGRPRKNPIVTTVDDTNCETPCQPPLAVIFPENAAEHPAPDGNCDTNEEIFLITNKKGGSKKNKVAIEKPALKERPRRRPKENSKEVTVTDPNCENQSLPLAVQVSEDSAEFLSPDVARGNCDEYALQQHSVTKRKYNKKAASACNTISKTIVRRSRLKINSGEDRYNQDTSQPLLIQYHNEANQLHCGTELEPPTATCSIQGGVTLPRLVSCLAHNGKVAWDVKWRPANNSDSSCKHRMGYLAVLLGNGSLEVWEVPLPNALRAIYMHRDGIDPRFIKLEPVFKCSMLKRGSLQCIPLTVEWSVTPPHDYLLAGCHDGTVALWKFSMNSSSKCDDTKPVLCFRADTVPIRTVAWAPFEGNPESSNVIVTAGHEGLLKFWDLSNPFHPLRNLHPAPRIINSLDWLAKPSCIIMAFEDGTVKTISLALAANEVPVTGKAYNGKKQPWLHSNSYSSFAIWSVHVSRITGMVACCGADGTAFRYQLLSKAVEKEKVRNLAPQFVCGSVTEDESTLVINTPASNAPFPLRKTHDKSRHAQSFKELLYKPNLSKSANDQMAKASHSDSQTIVVSDGDNSGMESETEEALCSMKQSKRPKLSSSSKKKAVEESQALVCVYDTSTTPLAVDNEKPDVGNTPEVFPSKMVALHRVRWNMNKGSERWLCFGGASGLVRCQQIVFSKIDEKWAKKR